MYLHNKRNKRFFGYGAVTLFLMGLMLFAGLWPFSFGARNNVTFTESTNGISFSSPAVIYDIDTLTESEKTFLADSVVTIHLRLKAADTVGSARRRHTAWLLSLRYGHRERALISQWKSHLLVSVVRTVADVRSPEAKALAMRNAFSKGKSLDIVIVTGQSGTTLIVDGERKAYAEGYRMFDGRGAGPQHLQLCGSIIGKYTWDGTLFDFGMYKGDVSGQLTGTGRAEGSPSGPPMEMSRALIRFTFERLDSVLRNCAGDRHALRVSPRFPVSPDQVLVPIWEDFVNDKEYFADIAVNFVGFIPFGYFFAGFFLLFFPLRKGNAFLIAVAAGFCLSLCIELAQVYLPGRTSQMSDLIFNTLGTVAGAGGLCAWTKNRKSVPSD
jgi:VanZ like family